MTKPLRSALAVMAGVTTLLGAGCSSSTPDAAPTSASPTASAWVETDQASTEPSVDSSLVPSIGPGTAASATAPEAGGSGDVSGASSLAPSTPAMPRIPGQVTWDPLPATLSPSDVSQALEAERSMERYWTFSDEVAAAPVRPSDDELHEVAMGQAGDLIRETAAVLGGSQLYMTGATNIEASIKQVEPSLVSVTMCIDVSKTQIIDASGKNVAVGDGPGHFIRFPANAQVVEYQSGAWLVTVMDADRTATC